jgi:hypothetical protein
MKGRLKELFDKARSATEHDASINGAERDCDAEPEAREAFAKFRRKLFDLPRWNSESALTSFAHFDADGRELEDRPLAERDFIRIALKGSGKYDWVRVARIEQTDDEAVITVSPEFDPTAEQPDKETTSHFFTSAATNNFCLQKDGTKILFYVIGLDEKTNLGETENTLETARNALVANLGYYLGIQKGEWLTFCRNFLELEESEEGKRQK